MDPMHAPIFKGKRNQSQRTPQKGLNRRIAKAPIVRVHELGASKQGAKTMGRQVRGQCEPLRLAYLVRCFPLPLGGVRSNNFWSWVARPLWC